MDVRDGNLRIAQNLKIVEYVIPAEPTIYLIIITCSNYVKQFKFYSDFLIKDGREIKTRIV